MATFIVMTLSHVWQLEADSAKAAVLEVFKRYKPKQVGILIEVQCENEEQPRYFLSEEILTELGVNFTDRSLQ